MTVTLIETLEITVIVTTLLYNYFLIKQNKICWLFGFLSSIVGVYIFTQKQLVGQVILHVFYTLMAVYGWFIWSRFTNTKAIIKWSYKKHIYTFLYGVLIVFFSYFFIALQINSEIRILDVFITVFCFIATFKEAHKVLSAWLYWIVLNLACMVLYLQSDLKIYALLMFIYAIISVNGYLTWKKEYR
jgi:nicotinamide mononucleotide transporter